MRRLGGLNILSNLVLVHLDCHTEIHRNERRASHRGWVAWSDPEMTPLRLYDGTWVLLVPDGSYEPLGETEALRLLLWVNDCASNEKEGLALAV